MNFFHPINNSGYEDYGPRCSHGEKGRCPDCYYDLVEDDEEVNDDELGEIEIQELALSNLKGVATASRYAGG